MILQKSDTIAIESLRLQLVSPIEVRLAGKVTTETARAALARHLEQLHARIVRDKTATFTVDVRALDFVDSSAIRVFIDWITRAEDAPYKLVFKTDRSTTWHRLSFAVLKSLAPKHVDIVECDQTIKPGAPST